MKSIALHVFGAILLVSCSSRPSHRTSLPQEEMAYVQEADSLGDWDCHQFFDDQEETTLDSLGKVIAKADSIIAYNWNAHEGNPANAYNYIVDAYGKVDRRVGQRFLLSDTQRAELRDLLTDSLAYEEGNSMCFLPHIAFVYYHQSDIIGQSNVCFLCAEVRSIPKSTGGLSAQGASQLKQFCSSVGLEIVDHETELTH